MEDNKEDGNGGNNFPDWAFVHEASGFQDEPMDEGEANVAQEEPPNELGQALLDAQKDSETVKEALKFEKMMEDHKRPLFPSCKPEQKKLGTTLEMLKWKATNGVTDKGFCELLKIVKNCRQQHTKLKRWFALLDWTCRRFTLVLTTASCIEANTRTWKLVLFAAHCGIRSGEMI